MQFASLQISSWRQFDVVDIDLSRNVTILTGSNGAGKSTLLRILSQHFGWSVNFLGTPVFDKQGILNYLYGLWRKSQSLGGMIQIGKIAYSNGTESSLQVPSYQGGVQFGVQISNQQSIMGLFIPSHRPIMTYQSVGSIPTAGVGTQQAYQNYFQESLNRYNGGFTQFSPVYRMKEAIISMATFGPGNRNVVGNAESEKVYNEFEIALRAALPPELGFEKLIVRLPDVVLVTKSGEFVLDSASGGIMSIIDLVWQILLYSQGKMVFTVILDEPENHLHPSMQRTLLQSLVAAFPQARFIAATHSPFIVSSMKEASVYVLKYTSQNEVMALDRSVSSVVLDTFNKAGSASDILRSALGVPVTIPIWAEREISAISANFSLSNLTSDGLQLLKNQLNEAGLGEYYPDALSQMALRQ